MRNITTHFRTYIYSQIYKSACLKIHNVVEYSKQWIISCMEYLLTLMILFEFMDLFG